MAFIGNQPAESFTSFATQTFSVSATTSYTLDHAVTNENEIALFVNNVRQQPGSGKAYTATGTALTLSAATASTDTMYCVFLGRALQTVTPATNSITAAMVSNDLISGKDALTDAPASTDELLISDAGTLKRIDYSLIKATNTPAFNAKNSSNQSITRASATKMTLGTEVFDTDSAFASSKFTVPSGEGGKYMIIGRIQGINTENERVMCYIYKNGSQFERTENAGKASDGSADTDVFSVDVMDLSAGDYIELYAQVNGSGSADVFGILQGYKIIE